MTVSAAAAYIGFVRLDDDMTDLRRSAVGTAYNLSVQNKPAADTGSERNHQNAVKSSSAAVYRFSERGNIRIVSDIDRDADQLLHGFLCVDRSPSEIDATEHGAVRKNRSGNAHADSGNVRLHYTLFRGLTKDCRRNIRQNVLSVIGAVRRDLPFVNETSVLLKQSALYGRAADIDAENVFHGFLRLL